MALIDTYLPHPQFRERHSLEIEAPPRTILLAARSYRTETDPFFKAMMGLRELPMRIGRRVSPRPLADRRAFGLDTFTLLDSNDEEIVYGLAGRFWRSDFDLTPIASGSAFRALDQPGIAKLVLNFAVEPRGQGLCRLSTETRVVCVDAGARARFTPYWYLIRPVSGLIRRRTLTSIRRSSEKAVPMETP